MSSPRQKSKVVTEEEFVQVVLVEELREDEACAKYGWSTKTYRRSITFFREKYRKELKTRRSNRLSRAKMGNTNRLGQLPAVLLDRERLQSQLAKGVRVCTLAKEFNCSEFLVRRNAQQYGLEVDESRKLPVFVGAENLGLLEKLDFLSPGILEKTASILKDPGACFDALYTAHLELLELQWFVQKLGKHRGRMYQRKGSPGICWSTNKGEAVLAIALRDAGLPHRRQVALGPVARGAMMVDFLIDERLFVEVDGAIHLEESKKSADLKKEKAIEKTGIPLLRVTAAEVLTATGAVIQTIVSCLG